jgi:hypothetical protein
MLSLEVRVDEKRFDKNLVMGNSFILRPATGSNRPYSSLWNSTQPYVLIRI